MATSKQKQKGRSDFDSMDELLGGSLDMDDLFTQDVADDFSLDLDLDLEDMDSKAEVTDPLANVEYSGNVEKDSEAEMSEMLKAFKGRADQEEKRNREAVDSEFWCAIYFQNREQKEDFLRKLGLLKHGDKYLDGRFVAKKLGVELLKTDVSYRAGKSDKKLRELV